MQPPSPELIFATINAHHRTAALKAAIELDLFTAIGEGARTAAAIAGCSRAAERGVRILCDYLVIIGLLAKDSNAYTLTPESAAFLDRRSPAYIGDAVQFLNSSLMMDAFAQLTGSVRAGGTTAIPGGTMAPEHPIWVEFARSMMSLMRMPAEAIAEIVGAAAAGPMRVLDIAAGHGVFGITIARHNPQAQIVAADWGSVLALAGENAEAAGIGDRYKLLPGSAFDIDFGEPYDLVLLTNFLHHFDPPTCGKLLAKVHRALKPGGRAATLDFVPNDDRVTPPTPAAFSLIMLATTEKGDAYTFAEYDRMFHEAGFARSELHPLPGNMSQVIVSFR